VVSNENDVPAEALGPPVGEPSRLQTFYLITGQTKRLSTKLFSELTSALNEHKILLILLLWFDRKNGGDECRGDCDID
jgi:hypothetical protein